jgi:putative thiamine transport system ATP-binding protein
MSQPGLILDRVTIALAGRTLLSLSHAVQPGEVLTVMGPSGSGKSTLLAYVGGFLDPVFAASGVVRCAGVDVTALPAEDRHAGILFQDPLLFPHMTVRGNIVFAIPPGVKGRAAGRARGHETQGRGGGGGAARRALADEALAGVGLDGLGDRDPDTLSGGQKARVALSRVLVSGPRMLLLDEPFSKLDADLRQQMRDLVFDKARASGLPVILVTHDEADAEAAVGPIIRIGT